MLGPGGARAPSRVPRVLSRPVAIDTRRTDSVPSPFYVHAAALALDWPDEPPLRPTRLPGSPAVRDSAGRPDRPVDRVDAGCASRRTAWLVGRPEQPDVAHVDLAHDRRGRRRRVQHAPRAGARAGATPTSPVGSSLAPNRSRGDPGFDPLDYTLREAHAQGLSVWRGSPSTSSPRRTNCPGRRRMS